MIHVTVCFEKFVLFSVQSTDAIVHCQPFHLELNFFSKGNRVLHYPVRAYYMDGLNLMAHNLSSGSDTVYRKLYTSVT